MTDKTKRKPAAYTVDFVTALTPDACRDRLERSVILPSRGIGGQLAPVAQRTLVRDGGVFTVERTFPGALHPIRLVGNLDRDETGGGTWVHGAITHDANNQVTVEGLTVFLAFFLLTALLFFRLRVDSFFVSVPLLLVALVAFSIRWRALRAATEDLAHWVRRRLYVTTEQVR